MKLIGSPLSVLIGSKAPYVINGPWQSHTKRMLRHKSLIQCSRIAFGFTGIYDQDEAERIIEGQAVVITDPGSSVEEPSLEAKRMAEKLILRAKQKRSLASRVGLCRRKLLRFQPDLFNG